MKATHFKMVGRKKVFRHSGRKAATGSICLTESQKGCSGKSKYQKIYDENNRV